MSAFGEIADISQKCLRRTEGSAFEALELFLLLIARANPVHKLFDDFRPSLNSLRQVLARDTATQIKHEIDPNFLTFLQNIGAAIHLSVVKAIHGVKVARFHITPEIKVGKENEIFASGRFALATTCPHPEFDLASLGLRYGPAKNEFALSILLYDLW